MSWFDFFAGFCAGWFAAIVIMLFVVRHIYTNQKLYREELLEEIQAKNSEIFEMNNFINMHIAAHKKRRMQ